MLRASPPADPATAKPKRMLKGPPPSEALPFQAPTYTMKEVHDAIPPHCFQRNTLLSLSYVIRDFLFAFSLAFLASYIPYYIPSSKPLVRALLWSIYQFVQGLVCTGLWELAHECGHQALSPSAAFNNACGLLIHSLLLVPYHSWRFTHQTHHKSTNNLARDIAFVPDTKPKYLAARQANPFRVLSGWELVEDMPIVTLVTLFFHQLIAFPIYLTLNNFALERMRAVKWWKRSHFYWGGDGPNFRPVHSRPILISDVGVLAAIALLVALGRWGGWWNLGLLYGMPYLWVNHWILTITFLHHTDARLPYYPPEHHSFLRGAAATIDRSFGPGGFISQVFFHGAIETHVLHHHASRIPFYHAAEASRAMQAVMGQSYISDFQTAYLWAFWKNYRALRWVEERAGVVGPLFFHGGKAEGEEGAEVVSKAG